MYASELSAQELKSSSFRDHATLSRATCCHWVSSPSSPLQKVVQSASHAYPDPPRLCRCGPDMCCVPGLAGHTASADLRSVQNKCAGPPRRPPREGRSSGACERSQSPLEPWGARRSACERNSRGPPNLLCDGLMCRWRATRMRGCADLRRKSIAKMARAQPYAARHKYTREAAFRHSSPPPNMPIEAAAYNQLGDF